MPMNPTTVAPDMRAWQVTRYGRPGHALVLAVVPSPHPGPGEILVRTAASVCNYNEVDGCHGRYLTINPPLPYTLGMEFVGHVIATGPGAERWMGRRVMGSGAGAVGAHAEQVVGPMDMAFEVPPELSDIEAAAFYYPFHLAYLGLHERGRLQAGETVLVHAAAGGVGSAAVQLAVAAGARVIATAGGAEKLDLARSLGAETAIDYRTGDFATAVLEATDGHGVDVCFDGVGGDVTTQSLRCLARNGRHLVVGFASGIEAEEVPMVAGRALCFGNISLMGVLLAYWGSALPAGSGFNPTPRSVGDAVHGHLLELLRAGRIRPLVGQTVPFEQLPQALEAMEDRMTMGRVVLDIGAVGS
ncbi:MAG TPA: NADPH:quinone oxidoreductase family protein [Acidimicrobiales bacterium]